DAQLRPARDGEHAGLPGAPRQAGPHHRSRPQAGLGLDLVRARLRRLFGMNPPDALPAEPAADLDEGSEFPADDPPEAPASAPAPLGRDRFYTSEDGLRLHAAEYGDPASPWLPVVCIPGLSRNARDFHVLGTY